MKKLFIILSLIISTTAVMANQTLDKIENSLYGFTYSAETDAKRLNRIEESVYGKVSSGQQIQTRIAKLSKDLSVNSMGKEIAPREDTFAQDEDSWVFAKEPSEASKMDYPVINELEQMAFQKEFKDQNIKTRLTNLEKKVFNKTYENEDLSTRTDRLKAQLKPRSFAQNGLQQQENQFYNDDIAHLDENFEIKSYGQNSFDYNSFNNFSKNSQQDSVFNPVSKPLSLSSIEKSLYRTKYENEPTKQRLSRIESSVFGTTFPNDSDSERLTRISSAINAQKSAKKYDSNRFNQNVATAVQIGTLILMVLACIL